MSGYAQYGKHTPHVRRVESTPIRPRRYSRATFGKLRRVHDYPPLHQRRLPLRWRTTRLPVPRDTAQRTLPYEGTTVCAVKPLGTTAVPRGTVQRALPEVTNYSCVATSLDNSPLTFGSLFL